MNGELREAGTPRITQIANTRPRHNIKTAKDMNSDLPSWCFLIRRWSRQSEERRVGSLTLPIPESRFARSKLRAYFALLLEEARLLSSAQML